MAASAASVGMPHVACGIPLRKSIESIGAAVKGGRQEMHISSCFWGANLSLTGITKVQYTRLQHLVYSMPDDSSEKYEVIMPDQPIAKLFQPVVREASLTSRVSRQIETLIRENKLHVGDHLPSERELAEQFGVSRTVIREVIRGLVAKGLLEVQSGSGTVIRLPSAESISQSMALYLQAGQPDFNYAPVHEVRRLLEIEIAGLAAERRTAEDIQQLEDIVREMPRAVEDRERFVRNDIEFHLALARATHNELFLLLLNSITDIMITVRQMGYMVPGSRAQACHDHTAIFEQVRQRNGEGARQAMSAHLAESEAIVQRALAASVADSLSTKANELA